VLNIKNLDVFIGDKSILEGINLNVNSGEIVALIGPNGSGKTTLSKAIMGDMRLKTKGTLLFEGKSLQNLSIDERAKKGIFLTFQNPPEIEGVNSEYFLNLIGGDGDVLGFSKKLKFKNKLLSKDLNQGFSGGERKKFELLQILLMNPKLLILDEIDSGLDVDSLRYVEDLLKTAKLKNKGILVVTHYNRIFSKIKPDKVYVMIKGKIVKTGGAELLNQFEKEGFEKWSK